MKHVIYLLQAWDQQLPYPLKALHVYLFNYRFQKLGISVDS